MIQRTLSLGTHLYHQVKVSGVFFNHHFLLFSQFFNASYWLTLLGLKTIGNQTLTLNYFQYLLKKQKKNTASNVFR